MWLSLSAVLSTLLLTSLASAAEVQRVPLYLQENADAGGRQTPAYRNLEAMLTYLELQSGVQFERIRLPWERAKSLALEGRGVIWGFSKSRERLNLYDYSETVVQLPVWAISAAGAAQVATDLRDLSGRTVCTRYGISLGLDYEKAKGHLFKADEQHNNYTQLFRKLSSGRCDYMFWAVQRFDQRRDVENYLQNRFLPGLKDLETNHKKFIVSERPLFYDTLHFATARGYWHDALERLDQAIRKGRQSGEIDRILNRLD